ncbi:MAG: dihydrofolate reductase, partial [Prevotella pleuritidis]|nr:dihydrofolate reductase [Hoylesella pleuritidis]
LYIIGGARVYEQALPKADRLYLTEINDTPVEADAFFPPCDEWQEVARETYECDERHPFSYAFVTYARR